MKSRRGRNSLASAVAALTLVAASPAQAHGPCRCIQPAEAVIGGWLNISTRTEEVIWNPRLQDFRIAVPPQLRKYKPVPSEATLTLLTNREPLPGARVKTPEVAPDRYLVLIYDGSENDQHYTWDYVTVTPSAPIADGRVGGMPFVYLLAGLALFGVATSLWWRRRAGA